MSVSESKVIDHKKSVFTLDERSNMCGRAHGTSVLCTDDSAALDFAKRKGASRQTRHADTKIYFIQAWTMESGQGLKIHLSHEDHDVSSC